MIILHFLQILNVPCLPVVVCKETEAVNHHKSPHASHHLITYTCVSDTIQPIMCNGFNLSCMSDAFWIWHDISWCKFCVSSKARRNINYMLGKTWIKKYEIIKLHWKQLIDDCYQFHVWRRLVMRSAVNALVDCRATAVVKTHLAYKMDVQDRVRPLPFTSQLDVYVKSCV